MANVSIVNSRPSNGNSALINIGGGVWSTAGGVVNPVAGVAGTPNIMVINVIGDTSITPTLTSVTGGVFPAWQLFDSYVDSGGAYGWYMFWGDAALASSSSEVTVTVSSSATNVIMTACRITNGNPTGPLLRNATIVTSSTSPMTVTMPAIATSESSLMLVAFSEGGTSSVIPALPTGWVNRNNANGVGGFRVSNKNNPVTNPTFTFTLSPSGPPDVVGWGFEVLGVQPNVPPRARVQIIGL